MPQQMYQQMNAKVYLLAALVAWLPVLLAGLGTPLLLLVCLVIPLLPVLLLWQHRKQLHHEQQHDIQTTALQLRLGFIYSSYRSGTMALTV